MRTYTGTLWRGVKRKLTDEFPIGLKFRWWRFSSCTMDGEVLKNPLFLGQAGASCTLTDINTQFSAAPCWAIVLREYTAGRYRAFCLCLCAEFKLVNKMQTKTANFLILKPRGLLCVRTTGERTLFSIKTKSGALHVHHHADGCIHRLKNLF